jgi:hypothetical protein
MPFALMSFIKMAFCLSHGSNELRLTIISYYISFILMQCSEKALVLTFLLTILLNAFYAKGICPNDIFSNDKG